MLESLKNYAKEQNDYVKGVVLGTAVAIPLIIGGYFLVQPTATTAKNIKGNKNSRIFHLPNCPNYDSIADHNIIWFSNAEEARKAGFRKAKNC